MLSSTALLIGLTAFSVLHDDCWSYTGDMTAEIPTFLLPLFPNNWEMFWWRSSLEGYFPAYCTRPVPNASDHEFSWSTGYEEI